MVCQSSLHASSLHLYCSIGISSGPVPFTFLSCFTQSFISSSDAVAHLLRLQSVKQLPVHLLLLQIYFQEIWPRGPVAAHCLLWHFRSHPWMAALRAWFFFVWKLFGNAVDLSSVTICICLLHIFYQRFYVIPIVISC